MDPARWHGAFDRGRLRAQAPPAVEFSANMQAKKRRDPVMIVRCKKCTAEAAVNERALAAETAKLRVASDPSDANAGARPGTRIPPPRTRARRAAVGPASAFSRAQLKQGPREAAMRGVAPLPRTPRLRPRRRATKSRRRARGEQARGGDDAPDKLAVFARGPRSRRSSSQDRLNAAGGRGRGRGRGGDGRRRSGRG